MVTKQQIKVIKSLSQKKYRQEHGLFIVEGIKGITEFLNSNYKLYKLYCTDQIFEVPDKYFQKISEAELKRLSMLKNPNVALAVFYIEPEQHIGKSHLKVALDDVRDPGNLGTIIRLCDWFGISDLICSLATVDCYNPKVIQASMGSLTRVNVVYKDLKTVCAEQEHTVYGTFLEGESIYSASLSPKGIIVLGNEANGIAKATAALIDHRITIPQFNTHLQTESLNVANATAIVLSEFFRRKCSL